jgi:uncharacterized protein YjbI with pentapeptide repeats
MAEKPDPFDIEALGNAVNDSASRVSTIWVSFLIFALYLLTAATTVTHRQLFLAEPVKLPVLNIDLPLWGFFFLAPILFVIFHVYVLLQVLLLAHTAAAYNKAVASAGFSDEESASLRQRLANTLFAQIFACAPRERGGWVGLMLRAMAWTTLAIAPILILVTFQFAFLPYHSHIATWTHRLLILLELVAAFGLWPLVLDSERDFQWRSVWTQIKRAVALPSRLFAVGDGRLDVWEWLRQQAVPLAAFALFVLVSLSWATFPGEPHVNLLTGRLAAGYAPLSAECKDRWVQKKFNFIDLRFDRLILPHADTIDHEKLGKIEKATKEAGQHHEGERTHTLRDRNLNCGVFSDYTDLRGIDFSGSSLQGASFDSAQLQGASFDSAQLQRASLDWAQLQGASFHSAQLQGASLFRAQLHGAILDSDQLEDASLFGAQLQGASLKFAQLQGASLIETQLQGAILDGAQLQGASLDFAQLQGAILDGAQLQGASLDLAQLQGADFKDSALEFTRFSNAYVWRARRANCRESRVTSHKPDAIVAVRSNPERGDESVKVSPSDIEKFIERSIGGIPDEKTKEDARQRMRTGLVVDPAKDDTAAVEEAWSKCEKASTEPSQKEFDQKFDQGDAAFLRDLVCNDTENGKAVAQGIVGNWISDDDDRRAFSAELARGLLGLDGKECPPTEDLDEAAKNRLLPAAVAGADPATVPTK